jgi:hypothetical protein
MSMRKAFNVCCHNVKYKLVGTLKIGLYSSVSHTVLSESMGFRAITRGSTRTVR